MKGKYFKRIGGFVLAALMLSGVAFASASTAGAQGRRTVIVRPYPYRVYRRFDVFGYDRWGYDRWGYQRFGYDPWSPYGSYYRQYVFRNSESAIAQGYKDGFKTGKADGKSLVAGKVGVLAGLAVAGEGTGDAKGQASDSDDDELDCQRYCRQ